LAPRLAAASFFVANSALSIRGLARKEAHNGAAPAVSGRKRWKMYGDFAPVPQVEEGLGLKPTQCGFESHRGHGARSAGRRRDRPGHARPARIPPGARPRSAMHVPHRGHRAWDHPLRSGSLGVSIRSFLCMMRCMRTNIEIDDDVLREVRRLTGARTKREAVDLALRELVARYRRLDFLKLRGQVRWEGDLKASRRGRL
jgi:Arc/MetJ family transcription regulator